MGSSTKTVDLKTTCICKVKCPKVLLTRLELFEIEAFDDFVVVNDIVVVFALSSSGLRVYVRVPLHDLVDVHGRALLRDRYDTGFRNKVRTKRT